jgi:hypothetical protein
MAKNMR